MIRGRVATPARDGSARGGAGLGLAAWVFPSLADVVFAALLAFVLGFRTHQLLNTDGDLARHLAVGRQILADGAVPMVDLFSYTKGGEPFVPYEWLSEVLFTLAYQWMGLGGVSAFAAVVAALPFLLLTRWIIRDGANPLIALALVTVGALATSMHWLARPHLFTLLLALLWVRALARHRATGSLRYLLPLPPMMALWANLHGGFLVGFVLLGIFLCAAIVDWWCRESGVESREPVDREGASSLRSPLSRRGSPMRIGVLAGAGVASLVAVGASPSGYAVLPHVLGYFRLRLLVDTTVEYLSPNFHVLGPQLFAGLVLLAVVSMALIPRRLDAADLLLLLVWTAFALYSVRNVPLFVVICLPVVARLATEATQFSRPGFATRLAATDRQLGRPLLPALCVAAALLATAGALGDARPRTDFDSKSFPVEALARAEQVGARGNLFNYFTWGGYILYAGYPQYRVFIDGQTDFYGEDLTRDYLKVARLEPDWESVLERYRIGWVLFPHRSPLSLLRARTPGWKLAHQDATADLFVRTEGP